MARSKRRVKQRSKAHRKWVGAKRKKRLHARSKNGHGARTRRKKKARAGKKR